MSSMQSKRCSAPDAESQQPPEEVVDRLTELLPEGALDDAVRGLKPEELSGPGGLLSQLAGRVVEAALEAEMTEHLGHPPGGRPQGPNVRNGGTPKTVQSDLGPVDVRTPRDRDGSFAPQILPKRATRLAGLDEKVLGLYAGGMTVRDISADLSELYGTQIGRDTISTITDAVLEDIAAWRSRPLERVYPIVYFDAMFVKVREDRSVRSRACYLALGVTCDGAREVLWIWWQDTEGSKFWLAVLNDLRRRGVEDVLIAFVYDDKGFPEAIEATFPQTWVQTCIVPSHPQLAALRQLPRPQEGRLRAAADLHRPERRRRPGRARPLRARMGPALPADRQSVAELLGARDPVPRAARRAAPRGLHHQHDRGPAPPGPQGDQDPRAPPRRAGRHQAHLPRPDQGRRQVATQPSLDSSTSRPQDPLRRPIPRLTINQSPRPHTQKLGQSPNRRRTPAAAAARRSPAHAAADDQCRPRVGAVDDAQQRTHRELAPYLKPSLELFPGPCVHTDLATPAALAAPNQQRAAALIEISFGECESF